MIVSSSVAIRKLQLRDRIKIKVNFFRLIMMYLSLLHQIYCFVPNLQMMVLDLWSVQIPVKFKDFRQIIHRAKCSKLLSTREAPISGKKQTWIYQTLRTICESESDQIKGFWTNYGWVCYIAYAILFESHRIYLQGPNFYSQHSEWILINILNYDDKKYTLRRWWRG